MPRAEGSPSHQPIGEDEIRAQLALILASEHFASVSRPRRFLEFVVEQTLAGKHESIKESVLGSEVFNRAPGYDPRADGIVRVEATKLRARLADYYDGPGKSDAVLIEIPKGSYVPRFARREPARPRRARNQHRAVAAAALIALILAAIVWIAYRWPRGAPPLPPAPAIAILPFLNLSSDAENEYFSDGLTEQLTDVLAQARGLRVASRTSAFTFKQKPAEASEIGAKLRVDAIVEGSVRKSGGQLRITAQLIRTRDGYHLWSRTYERPAQDVFALQDEISGQIAHALKVALDDEAKRRVFRRYTNDMEAFDLYLRGRQLLGNFQPDGRAASLFQQAIARDPRFAMAYVGIANASMLESIMGGRPSRETAQQMKAAAQKALNLDPDLAEAQMILAGVAARFEWNWAEAEREFRRAIDLNPKAPEAYVGYASNLLLPQRRFDDALANCSKALELDPATPQTAICIPWVLTFQNPELAIPEYKKLLISEPDNEGVLFALGVAYVHAGRYKEAIGALERVKTETTASLAFLTYAYGQSGLMADAQRTGQRLRALPGHGAGLPLADLGLGKIAEACRAAEQQIRERDSNAVYFPLAPMFAPLRQDPQFRALLKTMGLPL